jgi:hypothetical protein
LTIATANSSDQIDFYLQTKTQDGPIYDLLNIHFANSENGTTRHQPTLWRGGALAGIRALAVTDGALLDDEMQLGVPLGTHVRIRIVRISSLPLPGMIHSGSTSNSRAAARQNSRPNGSGYKFNRPAAARPIASTTRGDGGYGFSLDANLMASVIPCSSSAWAADFPGR